MKRRVYLNYPKDRIQESLIYDVGFLYKVKTNIRQATISDEVGVVALELEGDEDQIEQAIQYFLEKGVTVEPIELDIIE
ncbi:MAG: FeS-binding protein [Deltaproteobacteria bacterium]|nr:FeS-binding protein [Deltaproteobacteria bacterium]